MAILIDDDSASASEIVAAALQDNQRAVVVGTRSFGKGTVQNILPLQFGRSALRLTVARYFRPSEKSIHRLKGATDEDDWGVIPDPGFVVEIDEQTLLRLAKRFQEASYPLLALPTIDDPATPNSDEGPLVDPQLQRAREHLLQQTGAGDSAAQEDKPDETMEQNPAESLQPAA